MRESMGWSEPYATDPTELVVEYEIMEAVPLLGRDVAHDGVRPPPGPRDRGPGARGHEDPGVCDPLPQVVWQRAGLFPLVHVGGEVLQREDGFGFVSM